MPPLAPPPTSYIVSCQVTAGFSQPSGGGPAPDLQQRDLPSRSDTHAAAQFVGHNTAPLTVEAQTALELAISRSSGWIYGRLTQVSWARGATRGGLIME
jgi:hypothetical protein